MPSSFFHVFIPCIRSGNVQVVQQDIQEDIDESWMGQWNNTIPRKCLYSVSGIPPSDAFQHFGSGSWSQFSSTNTDDAWDRIRWQLEECDTVSGVQMLVDIDSGWGGYGSSILERVREECKSASIVVYGMDQDSTLTLEEDALRKRRARRKMNVALATHHLHETASMYIPVPA